jgi:hypothetical protein
MERYIEEIKKEVHCEDMFNLIGIFKIYFENKGKNH